MLSIPVYVLSVKSFAARQRSIKEQARHFGFEFEFVLDFDPGETDGAPYQFDVSLGPKSVSNVLKHLEAQKRLVSSGRKIGLVLEDDAILSPRFMERILSVLDRAERLSESYLIFLGGSDDRLDQRFFKVGVNDLVPAELTTAEAYLIDPAGCERRLQALSTWSIDCQADHLLKKLDRFLGISQYRVGEPLVTQGSVTGKFVTALDSSRAKHGSFFLGLRYRYNRFRKQTLPRFFFNIFDSLRK